MTSDLQKATKSFPELEQFELEMEGSTGCWLTVRAEEDERALCVLGTCWCVLTMLAGGYITVEREGVRTRFRLTPKIWQKKANT